MNIAKLVIPGGCSVSPNSSSYTFDGWRRNTREDQTKKILQEFF